MFSLLNDENQILLNIIFWVECIKREYNYGNFYLLVDILINYYLDFVFNY